MISSKGQSTVTMFDLTILAGGVENFANSEDLLSICGRVCHPIPDIFSVMSSFQSSGGEGWGTVAWTVPFCDGPVCEEI